MSKSADYVAAKKTLWLARGSHEEGIYCLFDKEPLPDDDGDYGYQGPGPIYTFCEGDFERITGIHLFPGEFVQVKIKVTETSDRYTYIVPD